MPIRPWLTERRRHYEAYRRPRQCGMVVALLVLLAGLIWIDVYEVPFGLRSLACDIRVTPWRGILASPKVIFGLPMLIAESLVWAWILICIWPMPALSKPTAADWLLVVIVFLLAAAFLIFQVAAFQPAPWHQCLNGMRGV